MSVLCDISANSEIFVLTGAGISKESGIDTFRDQDGLWNNHRVEDVATPEAFYKNPSLVYEFYNTRRKELNSVIKTKRIVVVDNGWIHFGVSAEIISVITESIFEKLDRRWALQHIHSVGGK